MSTRARPRAPLWVLALGLAIPLPAAAQDFLTELVQMPVAVTRLEIAGIPVAELTLVAPALNPRTVDPGLFNETLRVLPAARALECDRDDFDDDVLDLDFDLGFDSDDLDDCEARRERGSDRGIGSYVQFLLDQGLRGRELTAAIHHGLNRRGIPAGPRRGRGAGPASRGFATDLGDLDLDVLDLDDRERARLREFRRAHPGRGGRGVGRPGERGRPDEAGPPGRGRGAPPEAREGRGGGGGGPPGGRGRSGDPPNDPPDEEGGASGGEELLFKRGEWR